MKKMTKGELQVRSRELQSQMSELNDKVYNEKRNFTEEEQNKWDALTREKTLVDAEIRAQLNERELAKYDERKSKGEIFRELLRETRDGGKQREILLYPTDTNGVPYTVATFQSKGDPITDLHEDLAAEQKARTAYENVLRLVTDPDVIKPLEFLRQREIAHYQRFGESLNKVLDHLNSKNYYAFNPAFDPKK